MATEASRSSGSADSYVGSLISLTSKSDIRYEGILFNVNTEEASIGLRNVRSFGTEGRRKDGPQVPASDKVYEYIVFRGSDIKDLQVKSSPPVQTAPPVHTDPAIIQSHYAAPTAPSSFPAASATSATGSLSDFSTQMPQPGLPRPTYPNSVPLYQPGGGLASWSPSIPPTTDGTGLSVPMYWQGYYGPSGVLQTQQQSLVRPIQGLPMPPSLQQPPAQQPVQYPTMTSSLAVGASNVSHAQTVEFPPSTASLPNVLDKSTFSSLVPNQAKPISSSSFPFNSLSEPLSTLGGTSSFPALVTPGQFLQPGSTISQTSQTAQKDVEVVQVSALVSQAPAPAAAAVEAVSTTATATVPVSLEAQPPLLPLPSPSNPKIDGVSSHTHNVNQGGRERRRGNEFVHHAANFTEDFDFEAMNERFKKDEVWGHLGKTKVEADGGLDSQDEYEVDHPKTNTKPVYKKDDFFDTLSCNALDRESRNGRPRFSEQMRLDTETFGDFPRNRGFRGGRGPGRGGRSRDGYYGRGNYGYVGRGRGNSMYRPI